jgi:cell division protein FtsW
MRPRSTVGRRRTEIQSQQMQLGRKHRPDYWLLIWCAALLAIGLVVVYAISPALSASHHVSGNYYVSKQLIAIFLSLIAFVVTANVPLKWWRQAYKPLLLVAAGATLLALIIPVNPAYPAHRWVRLGSFSFQSVELVKFALLIALAGFLAERASRGQLGDQTRTFKPLLLALVISGMVIAGPEKIHAQSDLGSMGVMIAMIGTMCFIIGMPMKRLLMIAGILLVGAILVILPSSYRRDRLEAFMHPEANCQTTGYQACESLISIGSGGLIGLGLGSSVQAYGYQPEAANDSIFAIYAEKFGFVGTTILLGIFVAFFARLKSIAERLTDDFSRLLVIGVLAWFSSQALINIGGMIGLLPLKGITLPFISYGGTSVVFAAAAVGLVFQASAYASMTVPRIADAPKAPGRRDFRNNSLRRASY